jgi:low affinity Fe/Cu permease
VQEQIVHRLDVFCEDAHGVIPFSLPDTTGDGRGSNVSAVEKFPTRHGTNGPSSRCSAPKNGFVRGLAMEKKKKVRSNESAAFAALDRAFDDFACAASRLAGRSFAFLAAVAIVVLWAVTGPLFDYSNTWQLVINTGTTIVTFLMVFLIQHSQNRDTLAVQLKLAELIVAMKGARNNVAAAEDLPDRELERLKEKLRQRANGRGRRQARPASAARKPAASAAS